MNHLLAYQKIIESKDDIAVILEDDMSFDEKYFNYIVNGVATKINKPEPIASLLTPVISYLNHNSIKVGSNHKIVSVVQSWDAGYIINQSAAKNARSEQKIVDFGR